MKDNILTFANWIKDNYTVLIYMAGFFILMMLLTLLFSILYGYWSNGLWGTKFELSVGFTGVGILSAAAGTVFGLAATSNAKYKIDSQLNSPDSVHPYQQVTSIIKGVVK